MVAPFSDKLISTGSTKYSRRGYTKFRSTFGSAMSNSFLSGCPATTSSEDSGRGLSFLSLDVRDKACPLRMEWSDFAEDCRRKTIGRDVLVRQPNHTLVSLGGVASTTARPR